MKCLSAIPVLIVVFLAGCSEKQDGTNKPPSSPATGGRVAPRIPAVVGAKNGGNLQRATPDEETTDVPSSGSSASGPTIGDYVSFPAVGIKIQKPDGFEQDESFHGFGQPDTRSSVMALSIPGPFPEITAGFTHEQMSQRGCTLLDKKDVEFADMSAILVHFEQLAAGTLFLKWSLVFGTHEKTTMVTATFPKTHEKELSAYLKAIVLSTRLDEQVDALTDVPFTVEPSPKLKPTAGVSKTLLYTKDGTIPTNSLSDPLFLAGPSLGTVSLEEKDKRQLVELRLRQTAATKIVAVESTDPITIDGLNGYESIAQAEHERSGEPIILYQVLLFDENRYILMQGLVGSDFRDEFLPEFQSMARSLRRTRP